MINLQNCEINEFLQLAESKQIVCFCAGQKLREFCERFRLEDKILYAADNFKGGQTLQVGNIEIPIISMEQLDDRCRDALCVITSIEYAEEVIGQLDSIPICRDLDVYVYELLKEQCGEIEWKKGNPQMIPKKIHYCWFGKGTMPAHFLDNIESWKRYCPDYEIIQWDESNYDVTKNKYMLQAYEKQKWGFVPDYARLDIINTYGGIYFDTDVRVIKSFDILLQYELFCGFEGVSRVNFGQGFGAKKNHPIIQDMMRKYEEISFINEDGNLNATPSPVYQTNVLESHGLEKNGLVQQKGDFIVLSSEYFSPVNEFGYGVPTANTFSVHQYAATWYNEEQKKRKERMINTYEYILKRIRRNNDKENKNYI